MQLTKLVAHLDELLEAARYRDYSPNGLQVEGRAEVGRVLCGVTASQALLDDAVAGGFDAVLVHHGGEDTRLVMAWPEYEAALKAANVTYEGHIYPGAVHGFNNDATPQRYN